VTVVDLGGYTKAGQALGRSQPAVSLQMRRLEVLVGTRLIGYEGRAAKLTGDGEVLLAYARQLLRINDEAVAHFQRSGAGEAVRVGLPSDYAVGFLQQVVNDFANRHRDIELEIRCDVSQRLHELIGADELDLAVAMVDRADSAHIMHMWSERPVWTAGTGSEVHTRSPVPLIAHPEGCRYRARMIKALEAAERRWRIAFCSPDVSDLQNAVRSGLGVTALTRGTLQDGMRVLDQDDGFPPMAEIRLALCSRSARPGRKSGTLASHIIERLTEAGLCQPGKDQANRRAS
jgi:DNA-binding transcriptional LysR family regulator